jgi:hypothetical protein
MTYQAQRRLQITLENGSAPAERTHEDRGDQTPLCNIQLRPLRGQSAMFAGWNAAPVSGAFPITVFIVKSVSGKAGCSLGPLTDQVTIEQAGV